MRLWLCLGGRLLAVALMFVPAVAMAGPYDVQEGDVRGAWDSETEELVGIGRAMWQAGHNDKAEIKFNEAWAKAKSGREKVAVGEVLSDFYMSIGKSSSAIKIYEILLSDRAVERDSTSLSRLYDGLGKIYHSEGLYVKAIKSYRLAETLLTTESDSLFVSALYTDMSQTLLEAGDLEEALSLVRHASDYVPEGKNRERVSVLSTEAMILAKFGNYQEAYERMVEAAAQSGVAWDKEVSHLLNSAAPNKLSQAERGKEEKTDVSAMRTALEQADSMRRTSYAAVLVVGLFCFASFIFLYLAFSRLRYYREKSQKLGAKLADAQRVIAIIAHDSNNQFNALLGMTGILAERGKNEDFEIRQLSRHVFASAQLLYQMMNNLLTWSKSKENLSPKKQELSLYDCVRCCVASAELMAKDKEITISYSEVPRNIMVFFDFSHLEIILRNLLSNAVKFTKRGGHVTIRATAYAKHTALSVDDDGCGMSQEDVARFNKEQEIAPGVGTDNEMGNGVGLAICRDLVRNNGGNIVIEPGRKSGTSVTLLLNSI